MESQNSEFKVSITEHVKTTENPAVSNGFHSSLRELFPTASSLKKPLTYEDEKAMLDLMNAVLEITHNDSKLSQQFDRFVQNFQPETPNGATQPQPTSDTKVNPYAVKNTLLLGVPPGSEWSAFAVQWRRFNNNLLKQALDNPTEQKGEDAVSYLQEKDMDMFGYSPLDDELQLVRCNFCNKPLKTSRFSQHIVLCPSKNRADSKQSVDVLVRNDIYLSTEVNGADTKDEAEAKPVLAKRKITDTSFKIPKKSPTAELAETPTVPRATKSFKKSKGSPPSNGESATLTVAKPVPVEFSVKASKKKSADTTSPQKFEKKASKKPQQATDNNNKSNAVMNSMMFNNMMMQNYAYQQQMANLQAQHANNGMQMQAASVNTANRNFVNNNIKYMPQQLSMQQYANSNNSNLPQYVNMSLINNFQSNPMLASQMMQNQHMAQMQNQQLQNQQYAMMAANAVSPILKKPSNKKPRKQGENDTDSQSTPATQPSQGIIYVTPQQNQFQQQMYANHMNNINIQLLLQRQQQLQLMASKGMIPNTISNTINMNQSNTMGGVNPNIINMNNPAMNTTTVNNMNAPMNNVNMSAMNNMGNMNNPTMGNMNMNMTPNNTNMVNMNPMMTNTMTIPQNATTPHSPSNMQQRSIPQKATMAPPGTHTHVQHTQTQTINMTPHQYQQITQQQLQQLQLLQQQQNMQMLQNMNAAQQGKGQVPRPQGQTPTKMTAITPNTQILSPNGNIVVNTMNQIPKGSTPVYNIKSNNPAPSKATTVPSPKPSPANPKAIQGANNAVTDAGTKQPGWHSFVIKAPNSQPQASPVNMNSNQQQYNPPRTTVVQMPPPLPQYPLPSQTVTGIPVLLPESQTP